MGKNYYLNLAVILLSLLLFNCNDNSYIRVGAVYNYPEWQAQKFDFEGCRIIHNKKEYKKITGTSLPEGWDIDFDKNILALVRGLSNKGVTNVDVQEALTTDNGYHIKVWIEQNFTDPLFTWTVAIVMKKAKNEEVHLDVKYSITDRQQ